MNFRIFFSISVKKKTLESQKRLHYLWMALGIMDTLIIFFQSMNMVYLSVCFFFSFYPQDVIVFSVQTLVSFIKFIPKYFIILFDDIVNATGFFFFQTIWC